LRENGTDMDDPKLETQLILAVLLAGAEKGSHPSIFVVEDSCKEEPAN
jgi:hypothetical protein